MANYADGTILIDTEIETDGMRAGQKEVEASLRRMASTVNDLGTKAKASLSKQLDSFSKLNNEFAAQEKKVEELKRKVAEYGNQKVSTEEFVKLNAHLQASEKEHDKLLKKMRRFGEGSKEYKRLSSTLEYYNRMINDTISKIEMMKESGKAFTSATKTKEAAADMEKLAAAERKLDDMHKRLGTLYSSIKGTVADLGGSVADTDGYMNLLQSTLNGLLMAGRGAVYILKSVSDKMINSRNGIDILRDAFGKLDSTIKKVFSTMLKFTGRTVLAGLKKLANGIFAIHKSANKTSMSLARMLGMSILFSTVFGAISAVNNGLKEGVDNLAVYSDEMNNSLSMLMSSLTQLKNSFATAFSPILTVVAPILSSFINLISRAVTYVGMFIAALTGQDSFVKAIGVQQDYRSSLSSTESSASGAADATNELAEATKNATDAAERYLSPLDDINRWQNNISGGNGTGGGIGGIGSPIDTGIVLPEDMFETVPIKNSIKNLADKIKKLIKSEDWEGLGEFIADGINKGLKKVYDAISWKNVGPKITAFTTAFAETFNSLVDHLDFDLLGRTVGTGINTIVNTINQLADKIDWKNLGRKIAQGFNGLFDEVNWYNLGHLLGNRIRVVWDIFNGFVQDLDYAKIGESIAEGLNGIFSTISFPDMADTLATALNGVFTALEAFARDFDWNNLVDNIVGGIETFVSEFKWKENAEKLNLFLMNLLEALEDLSSKIPWEEFGQGIGNLLSGLPWTELLSTLGSAIVDAITGLLSGLWESEGTAGKIAAIISGGFLLVKVANITGISALAGSIVKYLISKFETSENIKKLSDVLKDTLSESASGAAGSLDELGKAAKTASSGGFKALLSAIGSSGAGIGLIAVLPVATKLIAGFVETLQGGNGKLSEMGGAINDLSGKLQNFGLLTSTQVDEIRKIVDSCEDAQMSSAEMADVVMEKFAEWGISTQNVNSVLQSNDYWTTKTKESVDLLAQSAQILGEGMSASAESINLSSVTVREGLGGIRDSLYELSLSSDEFGGTYQGVLMSLDNTTSSATTAQEAMDMIIGQLKAAGVPTEEFIKLMQEKFPEATKAVKTSVTTNISAARQTLEKETGSMKSAAESDLGSIESSADNAFESVDDTTVMRWGNSSREVQLNLRAMKLAASTELANMTNTVRSYSQSMYNIMTKKFEYLARDVGNIIGSIGSNIQSQMNSVISIVNSAISSINYSISGIESAMNFGPWEIPTAFGSRIIGFHATFPRVPHVPYLASGAVIPPNKEFMAVLGDQKHGTNIEAPLSTIEKAVRNVIGNSGVQRIEVPIYLNRREIARATVEEGKLIRMQTGKNPFELA